MCDLYLKGKYIITVKRSIFSTLVVVINQFLINLAIFLVKKIGFKTLSEETLNICYLVFFAQFLNSTFLIVLSSTNFKGTPLEFLSFVGLNGKYNHLSQEWYKDVGYQLIMTQRTQAFLPYYNLFKILLT